MRTIPDYPDYAITPDGQVWSNKRKRFLKGRLDKDGYRRYEISNGTHRVGGRASGKSFMAHRLVALTYIPNPDNKPVVDHLNRKRLDNRVENLRWATVKENTNNICVGRGSIRSHSFWTANWFVSKKHHCKTFNTKEKAEAYQKIVYYLRCYIRKMRGLSY
jgi:hypothetical protein